MAARNECWAKDGDHRLAQVEVNDNETVTMSYALLANLLTQLGWVRKEPIRMAPVAPPAPVEVPRDPDYSGIV